MFLLFISILLFNYIAYKKNKIPTHRNLSIWSFTIAFQVTFDVFIEFKYHGYWYFDKGVDWIGVLPHTLLIPPINVLLLSWFPFNSNLFKKVIYITCWTIGVLISFTKDLPYFRNLGDISILDGGSCGMIQLLFLF